jgi:hypothetical protein
MQIADRSRGASPFFPECHFREGSCSLELLHPLIPQFQWDLSLWRAHLPGGRCSLIAQAFPWGRHGSFVVSCVKSRTVVPKYGEEGQVQGTISCRAPWGDAPPPDTLLSTKTRNWPVER